MADNWIERRRNEENEQARRKAKLHDDAPLLWERIRAAVQECCDSFNSRYGHLGSVDYNFANGHTVSVIARSINEEAKRITVSFNQPRAIISATVDGGKAREWSLILDGRDEVQIAGVNQQPIELDDFTKLLLESPLFERTHTTSSTPPSGPVSQWS